MEISIEDMLAHNDFGSPKSERKSWRKQERRKEQLQNKAKKLWGRMVEEETENHHAQSRQQPFMKVDAPVARPTTGRTQQKGKTGKNSAETRNIQR
jgi:hypothetical protein